MGLSLQDFRDSVRAELGPDVSQLLQDEEIDRWVNDGQTRLDHQRQQTAALAWTGGATEIVLPADFHRREDVLILTGSLPRYDIWGGKFTLRCAAAEAGTATLRYWGTFPRITGSSDSLQSATGDNAILSYCLYRFYKRLASSRADFRKYAVLSNANGVDIAELDALSERHYNDFLDAREQLTVDEPASFFED